MHENPLLCVIYLFFTGQITLTFDQAKPREQNEPQSVNRALLFSSIAMILRLATIAVINNFLRQSEKQGRGIQLR